MSKTVLHQLKIQGADASGMSYVIETADDRIVVIDGGYDADGEILLDYLKNLRGEKIPTVDAWFLTHAHLDHTFACQGIALRHPEEIRVKKLIYRFPLPEVIEKIQPGVNREIAVLEKALEAFAAEKITPSTGDCFAFGDTLFEILLTCDRLPSPEEEKYLSINDTSTVIRLRAENQTVLFCADAETAADEVMMRLHGKNLKSDVCQVAHHGYASTLDFYRLVDPEILLWPLGEARIESCLYHNRVNGCLLREGRVKDLILSGHGHRRMELPIRPSDPPYLPEAPGAAKVGESDLKIPHASAAPAMDRPEDPAWEQASRYELIPHKEHPHDKVHGDVRFLWSEDALYAKVNFYKALLPSNPDRYGTFTSNNIHLSYSEIPVTDFLKKWKQVIAEGGYERVKFFPEIKHISGENVTNTHPEIFGNTTFLFEGGYTMLLRIPFTKPHQKGDLLSIDLEVSAVDEPEGGRTAVLRLITPKDGFFLYEVPAFLALAELI